VRSQEARSSLRLTLDDLSARQFALDFPDDRGRTRFIKVEHLTEVRGDIERTPDTVRLQPLELRECQVSGMDWHLANGRVSFGTPATLATLAVEGALTGDPAALLPLDGSLTAASVDAEKVAVELPKRRLSFDVRVERLSASHAPADGVEVAFVMGEYRLQCVAPAGDGVART